MAFTDQQVRSLRRRVPPGAIKTRTNGTKELAYIEGWYAIDRANRIFGFDGWSRETCDVRCVSARAERGTFSAAYSARVRVSVWTGDRTVVRDGHGTGETSASSAGEAHDRALKSAETDATKRALATFGKAFGLALHAEAAKHAIRAGIADNATAMAPPPLPAIKSQRIHHEVQSAKPADVATGPIKQSGQRSQVSPAAQ